MEELLPWVERYGYWVLLAVGFSEFAGLPIVSVPVLVAAGALTTAGGLSPVLSAGAAAAGGLGADAGWYAVGRWKGHRIVGVACRLSSNPGTCVLEVEERVESVGPRLIIPSKFLPGVGNLLAPAAGFARLRAVRFLLLDAVALALWASVYTALGWFFSGEVGAVIGWIATYRGYALFAAGLLIGGAAAWRVFGRRGHPHDEKLEGEALPDTAGSGGAATE